MENVNDVKFNLEEYKMLDKHQRDDALWKSVEEIAQKNNTVGIQLYFLIEMKIEF